MANLGIRAQNKFYKKEAVPLVQKEGGKDIIVEGLFVHSSQKEDRMVESKFVYS